MIPGYIMVLQNVREWMMKKLKNETALLKKAIEIGEKYAQNRGYKNFSATDSAKQKVESLYPTAGS